jgi:hypothetical protein
MAAKTVGQKQALQLMEERERHCVLLAIGRWFDCSFCCEL